MWHWNETTIPDSQTLIIEMRYAIITNPVSGKIHPDEKRSVLKEAAQILGAPIRGLETVSPEEFGQCARELAKRCDVLVAAGGDGTLSDVINAVDPLQTTLAYLPLGSGNSMAYALGYGGNLADMAMRIKGGQIHEYDLIDCDGKRRAFMSSVGLEGTILRLRDQHLARGARGFRVYFRAVLRSYFMEYKRVTAEVSVDESTFIVDNLLTLLIFKQPYYGYGFKVIPKARFDDGKLHVLCVNSGLFACLVGAVTARISGNRVGNYSSCRQVQVKLERPVELQLDGNRGWEADAFSFEVLPRALKLKF